MYPTRSVEQGREARGTTLYLLLTRANSLCRSEDLMITDKPCLLTMMFSKPLRSAPHQLNYRFPATIGSL